MLLLYIGAQTIQMLAYQIVRTKFSCLNRSSLQLRHIAVEHEHRLDLVVHQLANSLEDVYQMVIAISCALDDLMEPNRSVCFGE